MFWLIMMIASLGLGGTTMVVALNRMGGNYEKAFRTARDISEAELGEGVYGKLTGIATPRGQPPTIPGVGISGVLYELIVHEGYTDNQTNWGWKIVARELVGEMFDLTIGNTVVRVHAGDIYILTAPAHDSTKDLRERPGFALRYMSRVRFVPDGALVEVVGTLTREVDADPAAQRDYREVATRYRLIGTRKQPLILACSQKALPPG